MKKNPSVVRQTFLRRIHRKENEFLRASLRSRERNFLMSHIAHGSMTRESCSCLRSARIINRVIILIARVDHGSRRGLSRFGARSSWEANSQHERLYMNAECEYKCAGSRTLSLRDSPPL